MSKPKHEKSSMCIPLWESWPIPCHLPEVAPADSGRTTDREFSERLRELQKTLAHEERSCAHLRQNVQSTCVSSLHKPTKIQPPIDSTIPLDELTYEPSVGGFSAAGRAAVELTACLTRIIEVREKIQFINSRVDHG